MADLWAPLVASLVLGVVTPLVAFVLLRRAGRLGTIDAAAVAAHYGSVSAVTFTVALATLDARDEAYEGFITGVLAVLEVVGIVVALSLARRSGEPETEAGAETATGAGTGAGAEAGSWSEAVAEVLRGRSITLLLGGLVIGVLVGDERLASTDALRMLQAGSAAPGAALEALLERPARHFTADLECADASDLRAAAALGWGEPLLRGALAILWLVTAWVSLFVFPVWDSFRMLARVGVPAWSAPVLLVGASAVDAVLGVLTLLRPSRALWWTQLALIVFYSAIIAWRLPEMWAHPFGPLLKNVPIVAILLVLLALTPSRRRK